MYIFLFLNIFLYSVNNALVLSKCLLGPKHRDAAGCTKNVCFVLIYLCKFRNDVLSQKQADAVKWTKT